jgi:hypothetical protein
VGSARSRRCGELPAGLELALDAGGLALAVIGQASVEGDAHLAQGSRRGSAPQSFA